MAKEKQKISIEQAAAERLELLKKSKSERETLERDAKKKRAQRLVSNTLFLVLGLMIVGIIFTTVGLYYCAVLLIMGLLPSLVAYTTDMRPQKLGSKTVFAMNFTGLVPQISSIIISGSPDQTAKTALENPTTWLIIYGFAMLGWGLVYIIPNLIHVFMEIRADFAIGHLRKEQEKLLVEWGDPVKSLTQAKMVKKK